MAGLIDLTGQRFGRLVVIRRAGVDTQGCATWLCRCDDGPSVTVSGVMLRRGNTKSCGCLHREALVGRNTTHGLTGHPLYRTWVTMHQRCENRRNKKFPDYGGRGISVCGAWSGPFGFASFLAHVSQLPHYGESGRSLDRVDNDGDYEPGNVRWATAAEQTRNRRPQRKPGHK